MKSDEISQLAEDLEQTHCYADLESRQLRDVRTSLDVSIQDLFSRRCYAEARNKLDLAAEIDAELEKRSYEARSAQQRQVFLTVSPLIAQFDRETSQRLDQIRNRYAQLQESMEAIWSEKKRPLYFQPRQPGTSESQEMEDAELAESNYQHDFEAATEKLLERQQCEITACLRARQKEKDIILGEIATNPSMASLKIQIGKRLQPVKPSDLAARPRPRPVPKPKPVVRYEEMSSSTPGLVRKTKALSPLKQEVRPQGYNFEKEPFVRWNDTESHGSMSSPVSGNASNQSLTSVDDIRSEEGRTALMAHGILAYNPADTEDGETAEPTQNGGKAQIEGIMNETEDGEKDEIGAIGKEPDTGETEEIEAITKETEDGERDEIEAIPKETEDGEKDEIDAIGKEPEDGEKDEIEGIGKATETGERDEIEAIGKEPEDGEKDEIEGIGKAAETGERDEIEEIGKDAQDEGASGIPGIFALESATEQEEETTGASLEEFSENLGSVDSGEHGIETSVIQSIIAGDFDLAEHNIDTEPEIVQNLIAEPLPVEESVELPVLSDGSTRRVLTQRRRLGAVGVP
jgi:hypothetical protein